MILFILSSSSHTKILPSERETLEIFRKPICILNNSEYSNKRKIQIVRQFQKNISRNPKDFKKNKALEKKGLLKTSPKRLTYKYFLKKKYSVRQREFAFFLMTLFGEARNLKEKDIEMVARVINNRRHRYNKSYVQTVTDLAQFSTWYYKNQKDNAILLCPGKEYHYLWQKVFKVAKEQFENSDLFLGSEHYYAPRNMSPRNRVPEWSKGRYAVGYGGHVFLVDKKFKAQNEDLKVVYIPKKTKKISIRKGKIKIYKNKKRGG